MSNKIPMLTLFFWWCAGVNKQLLQQCQTEHNKYTAIGVTILLNGMLAMVSSSYALYTVFHSLILATICGIGWGILIFNLDRYIVMTIRKTEQTSFSQWLIAGMRIAMTIVLSAVITEPLMLKIFEKEIDAQLAMEHQQVMAQVDTQLSERYREIPMLTAEILALRTEINNKEGAVSALYDDFIGEANGTRGSKLIGTGPLYNQKKERYELERQALETLRTRNLAHINSIEQQIAAMRSQKDGEQNHISQTNKVADGILARQIALKQLTETKPGAKTLVWLLMIAFVLLETTPITAKLFSQRGPYDHALENSEQLLVNMERSRIEVDKEVLELALKSKLNNVKQVVKLKDKVANEVMASTGYTDENNNFDALNRDYLRADLEHRIRTTIEKEFQQTLPQI